jgi:hypothetical protein
MMIVAMISRILIEFVEKTVKIHSSSFPVATQSMLMPQPAAKKLPDIEENSPDDN